MFSRFYVYSAIALACVFVSSCGDDEPEQPVVPEANALERVWEFDALEDWVYFHQDTATVDQWVVADGKLALTTRANTYDRTKMHTADGFYGEGVYRWRTYVPEIAAGDQVSVGSWIYCDDEHELDFEVGYGTSAARSKANAGEGQLVACMTCQAFPYKSGYVAIDPGWHDFEIVLTVRKDGNYKAEWSIDGASKQTLDLKFGPEYGFLIHCSVENLKFLGDHIATRNYTAYYDRVSFKGFKSYK